MLAHLADADPAIAGMVIGKAVYFLIGRMPPQLIHETLPIIVAAIDRVLGPGAGNVLAGRAIRKCHPQDDRNER